MKQPPKPARNNVWIDSALLAQAKKATGNVVTAQVVEAALKGMVQKVNSEKLANLAGCDPAYEITPRRKT